MVSWSGALAASLVASFLAWRLGALSMDGALAAVVVGTVVAGAGGWSWAVLLILFVAAASGVSALPPRAQPPRRRARQVVANGGVACVAALAHGLGVPELQAAFAGSVCAAWADTWATEFGVRFGTRPRRLWDLKPVDPGVSGGVTLVGTAAGVAAAGCCGLATWALGLAPAAATAAAGTFGMLVDSLLGAAVQAQFQCERCGRSGEDPVCPCGGPVQRVRGRAGWDNHWTNFVATGVAGLVSLWATYHGFGR